jgi:DNA invertase Pin-like site-specific DNA recombinase
VQARGWNILGEYVDKGISGAKDQRPGLNALMEIAAKRKVDVVLVWRFDRFARSVKHLVTALEQFRSLGIEFISYQDNIDTSTPTGKMTFNLIAAIAEFERELIRERILSGLSRVKAQGKILGRPKKTQDVGRIQALHAQGKSLRVTAKELGISKNTVAQVLSL